MSLISSAAWVAVALAAGVASAQQQPAAPTPPDRSAFDGYRPFTEETVAPWRGTNDTVRDIGGWRAYAREAQAQSAVPAQPASAASSSPRPAAAHQH